MQTELTAVQLAQLKDHLAAHPDTQNLPATAVDAVALLHGLVAIPSLSRQETQAAGWLAEQMTRLGYARAFVDEAGNAVGEMGEAVAGRTVVLLGHIDTVPGDIPVRIEATADGPVLFGRGSVDAKGPLAAFTWAVGQIGHAWCVEQDVRLVVVGAVEEEAATSKGARFICDRFAQSQIPLACIIGEPSGWHRVTLGYKGRLLVEIYGTRPMAHSAGPDAGVAADVVALWNRIAESCRVFNLAQPRAFDQLLPSLRTFHTGTDDSLDDWARAQVGLRLPEGFDVGGFVAQLVGWAQEVVGQDATAVLPDPTAIEAAAFTGPNQHEIVVDSGPGGEQDSGTAASTRFTLGLRGYEPAWRSDRQNPLVRSFLGAIRTVEPQAKPGFVVKTGTSDMNVVAPVWQCPILAYGPGDSGLDHTPNEHVPLLEYWRSTLVLENALRNLCAMP